MLRFLCLVAVKNYVLMSEATSDQTYMLKAEEFKSLRGLVETFINEEGDFTGPFAYRLVMQSFERYIGDLSNQGYPAMSHEAASACDKLYDLEDMFLDPVNERSHPVPQGQIDLKSPDA
jgi:hypothetical protein